MKVAKRSGGLCKGIEYQRPSIDFAAAKILEMAKNEKNQCDAMR